MASARPAPSPSNGYVVVLLGAAGFVMGCFLPYVDYVNTAPPDFRSPSLYQLLTVGDSVAGTVGAILQQFAGVATIAWVAVSALRRARGWHRAAVLVLGIAWSLTWLGALLSQPAELAKGVGYWLILASIGVVAAGAALVWVSPRQARISERDPTAAATHN